ncbi:MAG: hypothetical protein AB7I59_00635 [Geminicoccaceae bacterium]
MANLRTRRPRLDPDSFIAAAETAAETTTAPPSELPERQPAPTARAGQGRGEPLPWRQPGVRADVTKPFNLRLPEPLKLKLDYIRARTRISVHEFVMEALVPAVEAELERLKRERR